MKPVLTTVKDNCTPWTDAEFLKDATACLSSLLDEADRAWKEHEQGLTEPYPNKSESGEGISEAKT